MYNMQEPYFAASAILPCGDEVMRRREWERARLESRSRKFPTWSSDTWWDDSDGRIKRWTWEAFSIYSGLTGRRGCRRVRQPRVEGYGQKVTMAIVRQLEAGGWRLEAWGGGGGGGGGGGYLHACRLTAAIQASQS